MSRWHTTLLTLGVIVILLLGWWSGWFDSAPVSKPGDTDTPSPDPRLAYKGPFKNIHPDVKYVGDAVCAQCHYGHATGFHAHPMGQSIRKTSLMLNEPHFKKDVSFDKIGATWTMDREGDKVFHVEQIFDRDKKVVAEMRTPVDYVIGSGQRGHSFFTFQSGAIYQTQISWYSQKKIWDLSPGFQESRLRPVTSSCLVCHSGGVRPQGQTLNRFNENAPFQSAAISCERCHGPGQLHVEAREQRYITISTDRPIDYTIVNPIHLKPALRENICQQCHLEGTARVLRRSRGVMDFRPGMKLDDVWRIFVLARHENDHHNAVSHVEQMYQSECFIQSKGKMGCLSCHDVHSPPVGEKEKVRYYRNKCMECHKEPHHNQPPKKRLEMNKGSCISCHMPKFKAADIVHTAATDHRVLKNPNEKGKHANLPKALKGYPITPFELRKGLEEDPEFQRDLALGLYMSMHEVPLNQVESTVNASVRMMKEAIKRHPHDDEGILMLSELQSRRRQSDETKREALVRLKSLLSRQPNNERALEMSAKIHGDLDEHAESLKNYEMLVKVNPTRLEHWLKASELSVRLKKWDQAKKYAEQALKLHPTHPAPRVILVYVLRKQGKHTEANRYNRVLIAMPESLVAPHRKVLKRVVSTSSQ